MAVVHLFFSLKVKCEQLAQRSPPCPILSDIRGLVFAVYGKPSLACPSHWRISRNWEKNLVGKSGNKAVTGKPQPVGSNKFLDKQHIFLPFESGKGKVHLSLNLGFVLTNLFAEAPDMAMNQIITR